MMMTDSFWPQVNPDSDVPIYVQFVDAFVNKVKDGTYASGLRLPSLNVMSGLCGISRETVYKAYKTLLKNGFIVSRQGKGYYVSTHSSDNVISVLVLLSEMNPNMAAVLSALNDGLGEAAKVTIRFHNQNPETFRDDVVSSMGKFDYYLIFPHFPEETFSSEQVCSVLRRIPPEKLIVMDRFIPSLGTDCGMSYQYISLDIQSALADMVPVFRRFNRLRAMPVYTSLYGREIDDALRLFCRRNNIPFEQADIDSLELYRGDVLFVFGCSPGRAFVSLAEKIGASSLKVGSDIGIICYDDFQINEILLGGLTTMAADYQQMGREAASMILSGIMKKVHCACRLVRRCSF